MIWLKLLLCCLIILFAGTKLARYGDAISERTGLGRMWIGLILIGLVTSMPEMVTGISSAAFVGQPDLALGNFWGSCIFNLSILAVLDIFYRKEPVLTAAGNRYILPAFLGIL
ncbi:MAG TPA: cation transporter, partial [Dehalococcoidia bacterium]|nr:cation transporter [Dehalococcoidia bacterium]